MDKNFKKLSQSLQVLAEPNRLKIINALSEQEKICVSAVAKKLQLSIAVVSYHLQALARAGLVEPVRTGKLICYKPVKSGLLMELQRLFSKYK